MKILKLLNKKYFSIILVLLLIVPSYSEEQPVDIWNIDKKKIEEQSLKNNSQNSQEEEIEIKDNSDSNIYDMQSQKEVSVINLEEKLEAMPKSQKLRNIANRDFDVGIGAAMRMVDEMDIPASSDEIEKERQKYLKSQMGPYYKYGIETLPRTVAKPNKYDIDT